MLVEWFMHTEIATCACRGEVLCCVYDLGLMYHYMYAVVSGLPYTHSNIMLERVFDFQFCP